MARLGREIEVTLADGRALVVRDARTRDARGVTRDARRRRRRAAGHARPAPRRGRAGATGGGASPTRCASPRGLLPRRRLRRRRRRVTSDCGPTRNPASAHVAWLGMSVAAGFRGVGARRRPARGGGRVGGRGRLPRGWRSACSRRTPAPWPSTSATASSAKGCAARSTAAATQYHDEVLMARSSHRPVIVAMHRRTALIALVTVGLVVLAVPPGRRRVRPGLAAAAAHPAVPGGAAGQGHHDARGLGAVRRSSTSSGWSALTVLLVWSFDRLGHHWQPLRALAAAAEEAAPPRRGLPCRP